MELSLRGKGRPCRWTRAEQLEKTGLAQGHVAAFADNHMVQNILSVGRIRSAGAELNARDFSFEGLLFATISVFKGQAREQSIDLRSKVAPDADEFRGDFDIISRMFENLVSNAIRYTRAGGDIHISVERSHSGVKVSVADRGPGIPEHLRQKVF